MKLNRFLQFRNGLNRQKEPVLFIEGTRQVGPKPAPGSKESPFDWSKKITLMLNVAELGEIVAYIRFLRMEAIDQHHKADNHSSGFYFKRPETNEEKKYGNWIIKMYRKQNEELNSVSCYLTMGEVIQLMILAEEILRNYFSVGTENVKNKISKNPS